MNLPEISTLKDLKKSGYISLSVKEELRKNLLSALASNTPLFSGIIGYQHSVIPEIERAILAKHHINFLGLRGQAKTKMARLLTELLDEWIPFIKGSEINDDPFNPISAYGKNVIQEYGDQTPIDWLHRSDRYVEKLATPDVTVADLIGDVDPIKAANLKVSYSDEKAIHFGLVPRSHRCIFVINELPDLQPRIQVALFNILQEGDIQIRGFKLRMPLDIQFVFTANPEDYTNRGSIVTPLKDRIGSQILTHYPKDLETALQISEQEAQYPSQINISLPDFVAEIIENIAFEARKSEYVDQKSGVSARLSISVREAVLASAERRATINHENATTVRIADIFSAIQAINGKIEMVYEGEQEGAYNVAYNLIVQSIKSRFSLLFPIEDKQRKADKKPLDPYREIIRWFGDGNTVDIANDASNQDFKKAIAQVPGLLEISEKYQPKLSDQERLISMEWVLHALGSLSKISATSTERIASFKDLLSSMFSASNQEE